MDGKDAAKPIRLELEGLLKQMSDLLTQWGISLFYAEACPSSVSATDSSDGDLASPPYVMWDAFHGSWEQFLAVAKAFSVKVAGRTPFELDQRSC